MSLLLELIWAHLCVLIKREKLTQGFDDTTLTAKTQYSNKYSNIQYSNATKMYKFKAKDCEVKKNQLRLGNISGHVSANNITRSRIKQMFVWYICWLWDFWH